MSVDRGIIIGVNELENLAFSPESFRSDGRGVVVGGSLDGGSLRRAA